MARIVVGMSGGVDSSVAALLLKQQGHEVIGLFMRNWNDASYTLEDECPWIDDSRDAMMVAEQLDIPFQVLDLSEEYKKRIVDYMFDEYAIGRTPNPDILCNREIKFDLFLKEALKLGADFVATGHYVRKGETIVNGETMYRLLSGKDPNKDQSYFLCQLTQEQLKYAIFPIGELLKPQVREIAENAGILTANKKDSQGLCFIGKVSLPDFLQQKLQTKTGSVIEIDPNHPKIEKYLETSRTFNGYVPRPVFNMEDGKKVGEHKGAHFYTLGQRKGLHIGGTGEPLFVIQTDTTENVVYVGRGESHPGLFTNGIIVQWNDMHWIRPDKMPKKDEQIFGKFRIRYRQTLFDGEIFSNVTHYFAKFSIPQKAATPGQFLAVYSEEELVASGVISQ